MPKVKRDNLLVIAGVVWFIAFFYTGLGSALALTGIAFLAARFCTPQRLSALHGHARKSASA